ncbi:MAG: hypothetical protein F6K28_49150 [Microcoleus sp. SIO2G3]|nr:hypothetical protein [Microcoleus sp. SIO2G3]
MSQLSSLTNGKTAERAIACRCATAVGKRDTRLTYMHILLHTFILQQGRSLMCLYSFARYQLHTAIDIAIEAVKEL